ncbi:MAG TPA: NAD(P)/FAD-dependent oxidoreductase [Verrucomicrobiae bacterium]|nr:NAD(P)/FAD-dependent oxidoreductase [Verrucomicrobiae bacterium]
MNEKELKTWDALIVGGGLAGLSAAIYLGRAMRSALVIDNGKPMARWEPDVQNYLGFPDGISGGDLIANGHKQAERFEVAFAEDEIMEASREENGPFVLRGRKASYRGKKLLLATGIFHIPPDIEGVTECLGHSMFFCKDCDGYRVQDKHIAIYGAGNEAVRYALGMLVYSATVVIVTNGHRISWDARHAAWLEEHHIPVFKEPIRSVDHRERQIEHLTLENGCKVNIDVLFTTRGDVYHNKLADSLGAKVSPEGEIVIDGDQRTTVRGLYAAGCVTPANCQMIIAAGQGAVAAQTINRDLFDESLETHSLRRLRSRQMDSEQTVPDVTFQPV